MSAGSCSVPGGLAFRRIADIPCETCVAALETGSAPDGTANGTSAKPPAQADGTRSRLRYLPDRGPPGPGTAAPPPRRMWLHIDRWSSPPSRTAFEPIPCKASPAHRNLLLGRPPPAELIDPLAAAALARTAHGLRHRNPATRTSARAQHPLRRACPAAALRTRPMPHRSLPSRAEGAAAHQPTAKEGP